ncbi:hypothetical protein EZS27_005361 [termite gut metagenome]|uniref:Uncharacterized protein n=1 Tax=termite gut metagenome TaxID=433724 RepID=A0A5J4SN63_9ZZZZ
MDRIEIKLAYGMQSQVAKILNVNNRTLRDALRYQTRSPRSEWIRMTVVLSHKGYITGCDESEKIKHYRRLGISEDQLYALGIIDYRSFQDRVNNEIEK